MGGGNFNEIKESLESLKDDIDNIKENIETIKVMVNDLVLYRWSINNTNLDLCLSCPNTDAINQVNKKKVEINNLFQKKVVVSLDKASNQLKKNINILDKKEPKFDKIYKENEDLLKENNELYEYLNIDKDSGLFNEEFYRNNFKKGKFIVDINVKKISDLEIFISLIIRSITGLPMGEKEQRKELIKINLNNSSKLCKLSRNNFKIIFNGNDKILNKRLENTQLDIIPKLKNEFKVEGFTFNIEKNNEI